MEDKLFKIIQKIIRNKDVPDLHSFTTNCKEGNVYVAANEIGEIEISYMNKNEKTHRTIHTNAISAANRLEQLGINVGSIEI